jgi:ferredoxin
MSNPAQTPPPARPPGTRLKAVAERAACCGYGLCAEICPQVFKLDANGFVTIAVDTIAAELEAQAREAAAACPQSALAIEEG